MNVLRSISDCNGGDCPTVHVTDDPTMVVIQGHRLDADTRVSLGTLPGHEDAVAFPLDP